VSFGRGDLGDRQRLVFTKRRQKGGRLTCIPGYGAFRSSSRVHMHVPKVLWFKNHVKFVSRKMLAEINGLISRGLPCMVEVEVNCTRSTNEQQQWAARKSSAHLRLETLRGPSNNHPLRPGSENHFSHVEVLRGYMAPALSGSFFHARVRVPLRRVFARGN
jgi:hypothetical protein